MNYSLQVPDNKRRKTSTLSLLAEQLTSFSEPIANGTCDETFQEQLDFWSNGALFAIDPAFVSYDSVHNQDAGHFDQSPGNSRKRSRDSLSWDVAVEGPKTPQSILSDDINQDWLYARFPQLFPSLPVYENRTVNLDIPNPFLEGSDIRHPSLRPYQSLPEDGAVNGYIKFRIRFSKEDTENQTKVSTQPFFPVHHRGRHPITGEIVSLLPPDFGKGCKMDSMDSKLMKFFTTAFCDGRTLLPKTNSWLLEIAPMADKDECVNHAVLALAAAYVLDYKPIPELQARANYHYKRAVSLVGQALQDPSSHEVGKEDAIIGALILLLTNDCINWELRRPKDCQQRWFEGAQVAKMILDHSDPGYRYYDPRNVQTSRARLFNSNSAAVFGILAEPVTPLKISETDCTYGWLLQGTEDEVRRIHGDTGFSPKLLHIYAQITHFAARMNESPDSMILPIGAQKLEERLTNFYQWSDLSPGYVSTDELLAACQLDANGQVSCPAKVTELTGEAWVAAAQIYLQCRCFRRPRSHAKVKRPLNILRQCVQRMPCSGPLFTSQSPFFPIFLMGIVSYLEEDRDAVRQWFDEVILGAGCRSSVPPVWESLKELWRWIDANLKEDGPDFEGPIRVRKAWWEQMVEGLISIAGQVSLT